MIIGRLRGTILATGTDHILIDVNGVGYVAQAGTRLLSKVTIGEEAVLHIETKVTENAITLYAFATDEERAWFVRLQDVHGVAGKAANAILDAISPAELMDAIVLGDIATVQRAKGVGKKLAERIAGELAGKPPPLGRFGSTFKADGSASAGTAMKETAALTSGARGDAISALLNLGYAHGDAARAVATAVRNTGSEDASVLIKAGLKELSQ